MRQPLLLAADADVALHVVVPGRHVLVADGPVDADALLGVRLEVDRAMPVGLARPEQRAAADVIAADPVEPLGLGIGLLVVFDEEVAGVLSQGVAGALLHRIVGLHLGGRDAAARVLGLPGILDGGGIVGAVADHRAALQHQGLEALLAELHGRPAAGHAAADDDGVKGALLARSGAQISHGLPVIDLCASCRR